MYPLAHVGLMSYEAFLSTVSAKPCGSVAFAISTVHCSHDIGVLVLNEECPLDQIVLQ